MIMWMKLKRWFKRFILKLVNGISDEKYYALQSYTNALENTNNEYLEKYINSMKDYRSLMTDYIKMCNMSDDALTLCDNVSGHYDKLYNSIVDVSYVADFSEARQHGVFLNIYEYQDRALTGLAHKLLREGYIVMDYNAEAGNYTAMIKVVK